MVERALIFIIAVVFFGASWWWSSRQQATEAFSAAQLRQRDAVIEQLCALALPQVQGKSPEQVQALFTNLYPAYEVRLEDNAVYAGDLGVRFSEDSTAAGLFPPWGTSR
jgi:hypothetical protein